jgi:hypothetical protein
VSERPDCPSPDLPARADARLLADGWKARFLADPARVAELSELYRRLGFEVLAAALRPEDFDERCRACADAVCRTYVMIYTRSRHRESDRT